MSTSVPQAQVDAANAYESLFVPALVGQFAPLVADAASIRRGHRVLDVACGTGVLAREAAARTEDPGLVAGVDATPGMLAVAARLAPKIQWRHGIAESLPFPDAAFDAVVSQFGLMFFTDRRQALREMTRVVRPGGRLAVAVWDALPNLPAYAAEVALLERLAGPRAADAVRAPFVLGDRDELAALFAAAGITSARITTHAGTARFPSVRMMVESDLRGWLPVMGVELPEAQIVRILGDAEDALRSYVGADGSVSFEAPAHVVDAIRP